MKISASNRIRRAAAAVETAICLPFLFLLCYGVWEVGQLVHVGQIVANSAREGSRLAATGIYSSSNLASLATSNNITNFGSPYFQVQSAVANYLSNSGLPISGTGVLVTVTNETRNLACQVQAVANASAGTTAAIIAVNQSGAVPPLDPTTDPSVQQYDILRVDVQYPFSFARWSPNNLYFFMGTNPQVYASSRWPCMKDLPIVVNSTIPGAPLTGN